MSTVPDLATLDDLLVHAGWTRALAVRLLGDADDADDVVQETWLSALRMPPDRRRALRPWIATVVRNLIRSQGRRRSRARLREQRLAAEAVVPSSEELLAQLETERQLAALVMDLPEPYRHTVVLRYNHGRSAADIARAEQIPEGTVRWRLKYGLDELRRRFEERSGGRDAARGILIPFAAAASAVALGKGALAAPVLAVSAKAMVAAATIALAAVGSQALVERAHRPPRPLTAQADRKPPAPGSRRATPSTARPAGLAAAPVSAPASAPATPAALAAAAGPAVPLAFPLPAAPRPAQTSIEVHTTGKRGGTVRWKLAPGASLLIQVLPQGTRVTEGRIAPPPPEDNVPSRWCCHRALVVGDYVEGRACLRLPARSAGQECDVYGLQREVHCVDDTFGNFASGDLHRTGRLICEGLAL
jgi:RNA polymerase sigma-70 factor (ECF subfamily)